MGGLDVKLLKNFDYFWVGFEVQKVLIFFGHLTQLMFVVLTPRVAVSVLIRDQDKAFSQADTLRDYFLRKILICLGIIFNFFKFLKILKILIFFIF